MPSLHASDLGAVQRNVLDQTEQKQIKEVQDIAQRLSNYQDLDPLHTDFIVIDVPSNSKIFASFHTQGQTKDGSNN